MNGKFLGHFKKVKTVTSVGFVFSTIHNFLMAIDP